jgi:hypothetical protein
MYVLCIYNIRVCMNRYMCVWSGACVYVYIMYMCPSIRLSIHAYVSTYIPMCIHPCLHIYVHTCTHHTYTYTHIHTTYTHTYIHTYTLQADGDDAHPFQGEILSDFSHDGKFVYACICIYALVSICMCIHHVKL